MRLVKTKDFYQTFFHKNEIPSKYNEITYFFNDNDDFYNVSCKEQSSSKNHSTYFNTLLPKYLTAKISKQSRFNFKKLKKSNLERFSVLTKQKINFINCLIKKRINGLFYKIIGVFKRKRKAARRLNYTSFDTDDFSQDTNEIVVNKENFNFLKIPIREHLYKYQEHINNVSIYHLLNEENIYMIIGNKNETKAYKGWL